MFELIEKAITKEKVSQRAIASATNVSLSQVNLLLNKQKIIRFDSALKICQFLIPESEKPFMLQYCLKCENKNLKSALEYCSVNREMEVFYQLLKKAKVDKNASVREWARIYDLVFAFQNAEMDEKASIMRSSLTRRIDTNETELKILLVLLEIYCLYFNDDSSKIYRYAKELEEELELITEPFIRYSYSTRLFEILAHAEMKYKVNPLAARNYCDLILSNNVSPWFNATALFIKGLSLFYENMDDCIKYLKCCGDIYREAGREEWALGIDANIEEAYIYWGKMDEIELVIYKKVFESIPKENPVMSDYGINVDKGFLLYILGKMTKDSTTLQRSLLYYTKIGDLFRARMPETELLLIGEDETLVKDIISVIKP
ncbi:AimR family lysis-lysogeny pheromone receptor [Sutcliffiella horikoshii]|uniref:AimR family lysis-lysogeny pheromone receptor n=1 Tax=Sutcliffiella horikoshii TaxID=79883 RepID=UPI0020408898|nr:AimR family lysis-lysogeny pheromone receptor [Sutcliffiella horikoshii]MCM3619204.1 AimR family lysis-lysogeny pheromone receptor [Sutcliffiella horikoshii]